MDDLLNEFLTESTESPAVLDVERVKFEQDPEDTAILQNIFRLVHTIKGTCGFLGLPRLESVAHAGENVLGKFREGDLGGHAGRGDPDSRVHRYHKDPAGDAARPSTAAPESGPETPPAAAAPQKPSTAANKSFRI